MTKPSSLSDREGEALAYFFAIFWAALVLEPSKQRLIRSIMVDFGLVEPRGVLALTPLGKRVMAFVKAPDRPKYPRKKQRRS